MCRVCRKFYIDLALIETWVVRARVRLIQQFLNQMKIQTSWHYLNLGTESLGKFSLG